MLNKKSFMTPYNLPVRLSKERLNMLAQTCTMQRLLLPMLLPLPLLILLHSQMSSGPRFCAVNNRRMSGKREAVVKCADIDLLSATRAAGCVVDAFGNVGTLARPRCVRVTRH